MCTVNIYMYIYCVYSVYILYIYDIYMYIHIYVVRSHTSKRFAKIGEQTYIYICTKHGTKRAIINYCYPFVPRHILRIDLVLWQTSAFLSSFRREWRDLVEWRLNVIWDCCGTRNLKKGEYIDFINFKWIRFTTIEYI